MKNSSPYCSDEDNCCEGLCCPLAPLRLAPMPIFPYRGNAQRNIILSVKIHDYTYNVPKDQVTFTVKCPYCHRNHTHDGKTKKEFLFNMKNNSYGVEKAHCNMDLSYKIIN